MKQYILLIASLIIFFSCSAKKGISDTSNQVKDEITVNGEGVDVDFQKKSEESKAEAVGDDEEVVLENSLLWEITGNGLSKPSYLYGTIHLIESDLFYWPENTQESLDKTTKMVFEIDLDDMFDMANMMGMMSKVFMKDGMTLKKLLSDEDYSFVKSSLEDIGLPMMFMEKMKPMFLTIFAEGDVGMGGMDESSMKSYEMEFYEIAQQKEMDVYGLETMDDQIAIFDSIPYDLQANMLVETLRATDSGSDEMDMLMEMYLSQDVNSMVQTVAAEDSDFKDFEDLFLNDRNRNWIPLMSTYMDESPTFFAVGAGHLGGPIGVVNLLRREGYTLKPISQSEE